MKRALALIIFTFSLLPLSTVHAQGGCMLYKERVYVLDIILPANWSTSSKLQVTLVNEDSIPYWNEPTFINDRDYINKTPKLFKLNTAKNAKPQKNPYQAHNYYPTLSQKWYTCNINKNSDEISRPVYQAMIITTHKKQIDTTIIHLPYPLSLDICQNNLDHPNATLNNVFFDDGTLFYPITINLNLPQEKPKPTSPLTQVLIKYSYHKIAQKNLIDSLIQLDGVAIYDKNTLAKTQYIPIKNAIPFKPNEWKQYTETADFYTDNPIGIPDFRYLTEYNLDSANYILKRKFNHYTFNAETNKYSYDSLLSDAYNVKFENENIFRYEIILNNFEKYYDSYKLVKNEWVFVNRNTEKLQSKIDKLKYCAKWNEPLQNNYLAIHFTNEKQPNYYTDTLVITNYCTDTAYAKFSSSNNHFPFTLTDTILPKSNGALIINQPFNFQATIIQLLEQATRITLNFDTYSDIQYTIFAVPPGCEERDVTSNKIQRYISQYDTVSYLIQVLEVYDNGAPKAWGAAVRSSRQKVETWRYWDEQGNELPQIIHSRELIVTVLNPEQLTKNTEVWVRADSVWQKPNYRVSKSAFILYFPLTTDSIKIISGNSRAEVKINYWLSANYSGVSLYLLKNDELYVNSFELKTPIKWVENEYAMLWDYAYLSKPESLTKSINQAIIRLQKKYPTLVFSQFDKYESTYVITFPNLLPQTKNALLNQLSNEPEIKKLSQVALLNYINRTFINDEPTLALDHYLNYEEIMSVATQYNCQLNNISFTGNLYTAEFKDKIIDGAFILKLNEIAKNPKILGASMPWYAEFDEEPLLVEPDNDDVYSE